MGVLDLQRFLNLQGFGMSVESFAKNAAIGKTVGDM
jgi:hypothetical protein